jgi:hypothetical protein
MLLLEWRDASGGCALCLERPVPLVLAEMQQQGAELMHIDQASPRVLDVSGGGGTGSRTDVLIQPGQVISAFCAAAAAPPPPPGRAPPANPSAPPLPRPAGLAQPEPAPARLHRSQPHGQLAAAGSWVRGTARQPPCNIGGQRRQGAAQRSTRARRARARRGGGTVQRARAGDWACTRDVRRRDAGMGLVCRRDACIAGMPA